MNSDLTPERAAQILGAADGGSSEERHRVFQEKRELLEKKLAQAPTPGLKAKYREGLDELTAAFELLELSQTESDLGSLRPDLKVTTPTAIAAAPPDALSSRLSPNVDAAKRAKSKRKREFVVAVLGVVAVLLALGGWWWNHERGVAAEFDRRQELARQEALASAAKDETTRVAAEQKAASLRNEEEQQRESERRTRVTVAELETHFDSLDQTLKALDRTIAEQKSSERDLAKTGGWQSEWVQQRRALLESYRAWLTGFASNHPSRVRLKSAAQLLQSRDIAGAAAEAKIGADQWSLRDREPGERYYDAVQKPLVEFVLKTGEVAAASRLQAEEPEGAINYLIDLKQRLDGPTGAARTQLMEQIGLLSSGKDVEYVRWREAQSIRKNARTDAFDKALREITAAVSTLAPKGNLSRSDVEFYSAQISGMIDGVAGEAEKELGDANGANDKRAFVTDTLRLAQEFCALYVSSLKDEGVLTRILSMPVRVVQDVSTLSIVSSSDRKKVEQRLLQTLQTVEQRSEHIPTGDVEGDKKNAEAEQAILHRIAARVRDRLSPILSELARTGNLPKADMEAAAMQITAIAERLSRDEILDPGNPTAYVRPDWAARTLTLARETCALFLAGLKGDDLSGRRTSLSPSVIQLASKYANAGADDRKQIEDRVFTELTRLDQEIAAHSVEHAPSDRH